MKVAETAFWVFFKPTQDINFNHIVKEKEIKLFYIINPTLTFTGLQRPAHF
jgi:hypothetical protein